MTEWAKSKSDIPSAISTPDGLASLASILCTEELRRRPSRAPDYEKENRALTALASALADVQPNILQTLAETILDVTQCDSSGLSLLTEDGKRFYWPAIAGIWNPHTGGGTPRDFGPCGDVLDRNCTLLFKKFERRYPYLLPIIPPAEECLLVPFYVAGKAVGTIWAIMHSDRRKFEAEDERIMSTLGQFASLSYQALASIEDLKSQVVGSENAEAAVRELALGLEARIRRLVDSNIIGIIIWGLDGQIMDANEAFLRIVGYDRDDLASGGLSWRALTPPEWRDADSRRVAQLEATGIARPYEKEYLRKDGSRVPVLVGGALFEDGGDEGVAFVLDLSEQKRAEEGLRRSEAYLAEAQRLSHTGSWYWNVRSGEFVWSQEFFAIFGFDSQKEKASHRLFIERIHPEDRSNVEEVLWESVEGRRDFEVEYRLVLPGGLIKHLYTTGHCSVSQTGDVECIGTVLDITQRKRVEKEREGLRQLQANLAHTNRVNTMGELTASLAHEIKQPISAAAINASTCLRWLARDPPDMAEAQEAASKLIKDITRASDIISRIVSLFKKDALQREFVDLNELIREMIVLLRNEATTFSISINGVLAGDLPQIMADRVQLQQVFMNLMLNAIDAMKDVDTPGELTITSQRDENGQVLVSVADTGVGLPEQVDQIFDAFFSSKSQGTGMGLPISRSIIESLDGHLWATSNAGPGATFWFTLPLGVTEN
jgi:PAS domain S-box-containing protein